MVRLFLAGSVIGAVVGLFFAFIGFLLVGQPIDKPAIDTILSNGTIIQTLAIALWCGGLAGATASIANLLPFKLSDGWFVWQLVNRKKSVSFARTDSN